LFENQGQKEKDEKNSKKVQKKFVVIKNRCTFALSERDKQVLIFDEKWK